jgi:MSHA pilin protein MshC
MLQPARAGDAMRQRISTRSGGFTLVELISVMILIGILAAVAVARLDVSVYREKGFHDGLKSALQFARKAAVAKRRWVCVGVAGIGTAGSGVVSLAVVATAPETVGATCVGASALNLPGGNVNSVTTPAGVTLTAGSAFSFDALGRASAGGTFSSSGQPDITVEQETGYVH